MKKLLRNYFLDVQLIKCSNESSQHRANVIVVEPVKATQTNRRKVVNFKAIVRL